MKETVTIYSAPFKRGKMAAFGYGAVFFGVISFLVFRYLVPISDPTMLAAVVAAVGLAIGGLTAILGGSLFKKN